MIYQPTIKVEVVFSMSIDGTEELKEIERMSLFEYLSKFNTEPVKKQETGIRVADTDTTPSNTTQFRKPRNGRTY